MNSTVDTRACSPVLSIVSSQDNWTGGVHRDLASAAAAASATAAIALRRGGGVPKSCSPKPCEGTKVLFAAKQIPWACVALGRQRAQPGKILGIARRLTPEASQQPNMTPWTRCNVHMSTHAHVHTCPRSQTSQPRVMSTHVPVCNQAAVRPPVGVKALKKSRCT